MFDIGKTVWQAQLGLLLRQVTGAKPKGTPSVESLLRMLQAETDTGAILELAEAAMDNGVHIIAVPALTRCLDTYERAAEALEKLGYLQFGLGNFWEASEAFREILAVTADDELDDMVKRCVTVPQDVGDRVLYLTVEDRTKYYCLGIDGYWTNPQSKKVRQRPPFAVVSLTRRRSEKPHDFRRRGEKIAELLTPCLDGILPPFRRQG